MLAFAREAAHEHPFLAWRIRRCHFNAHYHGVAVVPVTVDAPFGHQSARTHGRVYDVCIKQHLSASSPDQPHGACTPIILILLHTVVVVYAAYENQDYVVYLLILLIITYGSAYHGGYRRKASVSVARLYKAAHPWKEILRLILTALKTAVQPPPFLLRVG